MLPRWISRRAHTRRLPKGGSTYVRESWALHRSAAVTKTASYRHPCPYCGVSITSVNMPNGGWAHFEGAQGLGGVKHPCLHRGEGLPNTRDDQTPDFFDETQAGNSAK